MAQAARAKRVRRPTPIAERRRARKAAREQCRAEQKRLKTWIPAERKAAAALVAAMRAQLVQRIADARRDTAEQITRERDQLRQRIGKARAAAKLGHCIDTAAGPALHRFGPR